MAKPKRGEGRAGPASAGIGLPMLAWRLAETLPQAERRKLALRLIESDAEEIIFRRGGCLWTGFVWDRIVTGNLFAHGSIQRGEIEAVLAWMKRHRRFELPCDVIVDVGANIGTSAIPLAQGTSCQVLAIEPVPELHAMLCRNIVANGLGGRVHGIAAAIVSGRRNRVRMVLPSENSGAAEVVRPGCEASFAGKLPIRRSMTVRAAGLDALLAERGIEPRRIAFVWADVQGSESDVMESAPGLWAAGVPLFCEVDPRLWANGGDTKGFLRQALRHFSRFIPVTALTGSARAKARTIDELPAFCGSLGPMGSDVLLISEGRVARRVTPAKR
ncbi:MAG TPA: FkbM family methyltransferase [Candidatus Polarisedimenticolia bacterium]|nr:FkbM family methyltransferase [Candidatus Polarisedimenticolia bacterium]